MKVSLVYVFIAASTIAVVVNSEINPRHRFLKAKSSKVSKSKASKSKSSKSEDLCADVDCSLILVDLKECFSRVPGAVQCNPATGKCEAPPDDGACLQTSSQCSERICGDDGMCISVDIKEGEECFIVGGDACSRSTCNSGSCNTVPLDCDDGNECTVNGCDSQEGCFFTFKQDGTVCGEPDACGGKVCISGECVAEVCPTTPEADACQRSECDAELGCGPFPDGTAPAGCPDGQTCCDGQCCPFECNELPGGSICGGA